jgi:pyruvate formate lyase activating enzyme
MMTKGIIFNIQKFSLHDGPGIRTVVFLKGCSLRCQWCSNPESQLIHPQILRDLKKCIHCGLCTEKPCEDISRCPVGALSLEGEIMDVSEVVDKVMQDEAFYRQSGGGVTLSGGEPLVQIDFVETLCAALHAKGVSIAVETTGYAEQAAFIRLLNAADIFLFDIKHYDAEKHKKNTGVSNEKILANLALAVSSGKPVTARIPVIPGFNDSLNDMRCFAVLIHEMGIKQINLLPFHQFGENKYHLLNQPYEMEKVAGLHKEDLEQYIEIFTQLGLNAKIGG